MVEQYRLEMGKQQEICAVCILKSEREKTNKLENLKKAFGKNGESVVNNQMKIHLIKKMK